MSHTSLYHSTQGHATDSETYRQSTTRQKWRYNYDLEDLGDLKYLTPIESQIREPYWNSVKFFATAK